MKYNFFSIEKQEALQDSNYCYKKLKPLFILSILFFYTYDNLTIKYYCFPYKLKVTTEKLTPGKYFFKINL